jgi:hypothetical protein
VFWTKRQLTISRFGLFWGPIQKNEILSHRKRRRLSTSERLSASQVLCFMELDRTWCRNMRCNVFMALKISAMGYDTV